MLKEQNAAKQNMTMLLDDLQSAWSCLQEAVLYGVPTEYRPILINHIQESTEWSRVYNLSEMQKNFKEILALVQKINVDREVKIWVNNVQSTLTQALLCNTQS